MTPRELAGWVPAERHEHYDAADNLTGYTVVIRESRMDEADLNDLLGLAMFESGVCSCGFYQSIAVDKGNFFRPETHKCPVCAAQAQWDRRLREQDEQHDKTNKNAGAMAPKPSDGRYAYMRLLTPQQVAEERAARAKPAGSVGTQPPPQ